jgi:hypothetical protein
MRKAFVFLCLFCCTGCCVPREMKLCRVVDVADFQPISGAKVWIQPCAPIHPFWPLGDRGVTNANGEVRLSFPQDFWWYLSGASANGYSEVEAPDPPMENAGASMIFYMKRDKAYATR